MATLVTDILERAARQCSVTPPSNWVTDTTATIAGFRDHLEETVDDILDRVDLPSPFTTTVTLSGDGSDTYDLPSTFRRLIRGDHAVTDPDFAGRRCVPLSDEGEWQRLTALDLTGPERSFRLQGYDGAWTIQFLPALETGESVVVAYISTDWLVGGGRTFSDPDQRTTLPRRIVECGIVWRYRERKGLEYDGKLAEYETLLGRHRTDVTARRSLRPSVRVTLGCDWTKPVLGALIVLSIQIPEEAASPLWLIGPDTVIAEDTVILGVGP